MTKPAKDLKGAKISRSEAVILKAVAGSFLLEDRQSGARELAFARGILRQRRHAPMPGDRVEYSASGDPDSPYIIEKVLPRKNYLVRPAIANLDYLLITVARTNPIPDYLLIDKLLLLALENRIKPVLLLTKGDLDSGAGLEELLLNYYPTAVPIYLTQAGLSPDRDFFAAFKNSTVAFAGQSGAGKSSFLNRQFGEDLMAQGELSEKIQRGKQTTRHTELFNYGDFYLADTPGFQSLAIEQMDLTLESFALAWPEIYQYADYCRFNDCRHLGEAGCAVSPEIIGAERIAEMRLAIREKESKIKSGGFLRGLEENVLESWIYPARYERYKELLKDFIAASKRY
ncbi:MAG: ribosome small subunit-dependent GTPase A [Eubacteriales bacterium]|nr:ribosome small subunit-dependent GTPase A [Eubacteriales bacterium]